MAKTFGQVYFIYTSYVPAFEKRTIFSFGKQNIDDSLGAI